MLRFITLGCCVAQAERRRKRVTTHKIGEYEKKQMLEVRDKDVNKSNNKGGKRGNQTPTGRREKTMSSSEGFGEKKWKKKLRTLKDANHFYDCIQKDER